MIGGELRLLGFFRIVAVAALILAGWRVLEIATSGQFTNPLGQVAEAQDTATEEQTPQAEDKAEDDGTPKRLTASDVMRMRATDVTEDMGKEGKPVETEETVLMRLGERRAQIERLEEELIMRERLIEAAEKRVESRIKELKALEARLQKDAEEGGETGDPSLVNLVVMYESMKPKDAARIFNTLDMEVLVSVADQMKPRTMAEVLAAMEPAAAQRLTLALARQEPVVAEDDHASLPKIGEAQ